MRICSVVNLSSYDGNVDEDTMNTSSLTRGLKTVSSMAALVCVIQYFSGTLSRYTELLRMCEDFFPDWMCVFTVGPALLAT